jgi:signal transduction histidine kinase
MPAPLPGEPDAALAAAIGQRLSAGVEARVGMAPLQACLKALAPRRPPPGPVRAWADDQFTDNPPLMPRPGRDQRACRQLTLTFADGPPLYFLFNANPRLRLERPPISPFLPLGLFSAAIAILAFGAAALAARPVKRLAEAAAELGEDINRPPLSERGLSEVRLAARALNTMQARIKQQMAERTEMLAAITHDLRTPLTRLRLRLEKVPDTDLRAALLRDTAAMQALIQEGLEFARAGADTAPMQRVAFDALVESVCADGADAGEPVAISGATGADVIARPETLSRAISNLIGNAITYGDKAIVSIARERDSVVVRVRDQGPGLRPDELSRAFDPFWRAETSRSRETGGAGLGLSIARAIVLRHKGEITLANHPEGGLEAAIRLPVAP